MIARLIITMALLQGPGALQPGTGVLAGLLQFDGGTPAAGVRVGAMAIDDPSTLASVAETDAAGRYRLTNVPAGKYFIVAGRLENLTYFPGGTDRSKAVQLSVEPAKITSVGTFMVPEASKRAVAPKFGSPQSDPGVGAYKQIAVEKNPENKKKLLLNFEKNYPNSSRLAEVYIELSRVLSTQTDFKKANEYAEKAVASVNKLKTDTPGNVDANWHNWVASLETSARDNLAWTRQMLAWQQRQVQNAVLRRR